MTAAPKPVVLMILDGFGHSDSPDSNAIMAANTPVWDKLWATAPHTLVSGSGMDVGLPDGQMGNSEVGHMNLGAGRVVYQDFTRVTKSIQDGDFFANEVICAAVDKAVAAGRAVHIMGLLSDGGVHSHQDHLVAMVELAAKRGAEQIYVHGFLDGRDTPPRSAEPSLKLMEDAYARLGKGRTASLIGRYFAMDRDNRWERVQQAYDAMTLGKAEFSADTASNALAAAYERDENDEFVKATVIGGADGSIKDGDSVICFNFRPDRAREITRALVEGDDFKGFERTARPALADYVMLTEYAADIKASCAFPPETLHNGIGEYVSSLGMKQLRIAETEKYAHVTFFFSGGQEAEYDGETRILVKSPDVATYDLQPEMSAPEVTDKLVEAIKNREYDLIVCNYANGDMVGHTGVYDAAVKAAECIDECLKRVTDALLEVGGECLITADHGNAEQMLDDNGQAMTQHTTGPVNLIYVNQREQASIQPGRLCDVSPTLLAMMGIEQPAEMTGTSLVSYK